MQMHFYGEIIQYICTISLSHIVTRVYWTISSFISLSLSLSTQAQKDTRCGMQKRQETKHVYF